MIPVLAEAERNIRIVAEGDTLFLVPIRLYVICMPVRSISFKNPA